MDSTYRKTHTPHENPSLSCAAFYFARGETVVHIDGDLIALAKFPVFSIRQTSAMSKKDTSRQAV